ncbi:pyridoxamine 5'-phosphate oxidase [Suttonella sp. R2A3]|uniref:pyridoxamine 5'-phosphate oxidase n=1 Tax=Suttonella sp. R2A3 TaxID=2908648 RepID=UPI001F27D133|nr:pyridoxamine 5'-phosphate oxidase [Suttonella sp. R2A3]UJF24319.1 pyridoxamine 5'-phosphate oxidase [Suttonella sp. R2A3]
MDIGHIRKDFADHAPLTREAIADDPFDQFTRWFDEALASAMPEANAFVLATATAQGQSSQRTVLLKYYDPQGFVFYTNTESRKAKEIAANPQVSMLFPWYGLQRQVKIEGHIEPISREQTLRYFLSRPKDSQLGAWASRQSSVINSRQLLRQQWAKMKEKFRDGEVPLPDFWGGYRIEPHAIEFWQGQPSRLHDRFLYRRDQAQTDWLIERLAP